MKRTYYLCVILSLSLLVSCNIGQNNNNNDFIDSQSNSGRDTWQKPELVIDQLGDIDSLTIADMVLERDILHLELPSGQKK